MKGYSIGTVILIKICQLLAPSTFAASNGSFGNEAKPPRQISNIKGVHCQVSTKIRENNAVEGEASHACGSK